MKIKTKSQLNTVFLVVIVLMIGLTLFFTYHKMNAAIEKDKVIHDLNTGVFELTLMTHDYLLNHGTRAITQWQARYDSLGKVLSMGFQAPEEKVLLDNIKDNYDKSKTIFSKLAINHQSWSNWGEISGDFKELQSRLVGHLMIRLQTMVSIGSQLAQRSHKELMSIQRGASLIIMLSIFILAVIIAVNSILMGRSIVRPIRKLQKDVEIVGKGNLDYPLATAANDELGELSRSFEQMARDLKTVMASRDELETEIEERKKAELAMKESKANLDRAQEIAHIGNWSRDVKTNQSQWSDERYRIFGLPPGDPEHPTHEDFLSLVHPEDRAYIISALKDATEKNHFFDYEFRTVPIEGSERIIHSRGEVEYDEKGIPVRFFGTSQDITETKKLQDQLQKARKMEAMGLMAGGIAHDLNNILSGIVSYPELLLMDIPLDSPMRKPMETIKESGMRAADVVADLITIARGVATGKEALNLNTIVAEYLGSAEHQKLERTHSFIDFKTELDPDLLNLSGSPIHIKKILMNLAANASEAIEGSGTVAISTTNRYLDEPLKGYEDLRTGEYAVLSVSDDGSGISSQDLERIFEPFYTKKVMGRTGTGLGLAVVWNTMQDHDGYINVTSSEKGTLFELYFPVTREEVADVDEEVPLENYLGHGEKILVVDDEERQREIATKMLTKLGYNAESVSSGEEAIEYIRGQTVDLIVLDMVMPKGINGRETYEEIIKIRPGQKAIIASGYAKTKEVDTAQKLGAGKYIKKPYVFEKIGVAVKKELEK